MVIGENFDFSQREGVSQPWGGRSREREPKILLSKHFGDDIMELIQAE